MKTPSRTNLCGMRIDDDGGRDQVPQIGLGPMPFITETRTDATMRRVLIIGCGGAGKTTLARRLARRTGLPVVHLDAHYWTPGWVAPSSREWETQVDTLLTDDAWIMDGNYGGTMERRLAACDTVIFMDTARRVCLWRLFRRRMRFCRQPRPDLPANCPERLTWNFVWYVWRYRRDRRPTVLTRLRMVKPGVKVIVLAGDAEVEGLLRGVGSGDGGGSGPGSGKSDR